MSTRVARLLPTVGAIRRREPRRSDAATGRLRGAGAVRVARVAAAAALAAVAAVAGTAALLAGSARAEAPQPSPGRGAFAGPWTLLTLPAQRLPVTRFAAAEVDGTAGVRLAADGAYGHLARTWPDGAPTPARLAWRWQVTLAPAGADLRRKAGDDSPAKVCLAFDWPDERVPFVERQLLRLARARSGLPLPGATLCWVWGADEPRGSVVENPTSRRVRALVLRGRDDVGDRVFDESRDVAADLRAAFGDEWPAGAPLPPLQAVLVGADADDTRGRSVGWVGGLGP